MSLGAVGGAKGSPRPPTHHFCNSKGRSADLYDATQRGGAANVHRDKHVYSQAAEHKQGESLGEKVKHLFHMDGRGKESETER